MAIEDSTPGLLPIIHTEIDPSLTDMIRENERIIRGYMHCGGGESLWDAEIAWDFPAQVIGGVWDEDAAKLTHAIGFISGVAAACDVTPLELLDLVKQLGPTKREKATAIDTTDITYRCVCSWVGGDPDLVRGKNMCPACWHHDHKRVEVYPEGEITPCNDCGRPCRYDASVRRYRHLTEPERGCFLIGPEQPGTARRQRPLYTVTTEKFGDVTIEADDLADAVRDAKERFGITNPHAVRAVRAYRTCEACDSAPCVCAKPSAKKRQRIKKVR